jgi:hypothetical protein
MYIGSLRGHRKYGEALTPISTPISMPRKSVKMLAASQSRKSFLSTDHRNIASS